MAFIGGATFEMRTDAAQAPRLLETFGVRRAELFTSESPRRAVTLGGFRLDRHEVTNARFRRFLKRRPEWRRGRVSASLHNGNYLNHWGGDRAEGKRLATEAEWECAAGGNLFSAGGAYLRVNTRRVIRGDSWGGAPVNLRVAYRDSHPPEGARGFVGYRCAESATAARRR